MTEIALGAFAIFFVTVAPLQAAPVFAALTRGRQPAERRRIAIKAGAIAGIVLTLFSIGGDDLLRVLGITVPAVRIGGGILLMLLAVRMVFGGRDGLAADGPPGEARGDVAVFPLAMPMIAGPGTITAVIVLMSQHREPETQIAIYATLLLVLALTLGLFLAAGAVEAWLGPTAMAPITGVMGIILMALAAEFVVKGLRDSLFG